MTSKTDRLDPRIRRTRQGLRQALMELVLEKDYRKITVTDLTARAFVNRSTFYLHFPEKDSLLISGFQEFWEQELPPRSTLAEGDLDRSMDLLEGQLASDLAHFEKYRPFYRTMLCEQRIPEFRDQLSRHMQGILQQRFAPLLNKAPAPTLAAVYLGSAYLGLLEWWLAARDPASAGETAAHLSRLILQPFGGLEATEEDETEEWVRIKEIY